MRLVKKHARKRKKVTSKVAQQRAPACSTQRTRSAVRRRPPPGQWTASKRGGYLCSLRSARTGRLEGGKSSPRLVVGRGVLAGGGGSGVRARRAKPTVYRTLQNVRPRGGAFLRPGRGQLGWAHTVAWARTPLTQPGGRAPQAVRAAGGNGRSVRRAARSASAGWRLPPASAGPGTRRRRGAVTWAHLLGAAC